MDPVEPTTKRKHERETWGKQIEFLFSCISMSVGLGNIWRFPFIALQNGGGAFVIPYLIVLFLVGKPIYFLEATIGQFSSKGSVKVYDLCPACKGIGVGQVLSLAAGATYYSALISIIFKYFFDSFSSELPWGQCNPSWSNLSDIKCIPSKFSNNNQLEIFNETSKFNQTMSSAELYFVKNVLKENSNGLDGSFGTPNLDLLIFLILSWTIVFFITIKGIKSTGKASYLFVILPYLILGILLVRSLTLPGAISGISFFLKPRWEEMLKAKVWYSAVTQVFFSLSVCFSDIIMYASYNKFNHNVYRDVTIITSLDTFTSLLAGCSIFGILGNLAYETGASNVADVIREESGFVFISYPDALAKFTVLPQLFSALFFFMLLTLGIGTIIAQTNCFMTVIRDQFPGIQHWKVISGIAVVMVCLGSIYLTPNGQPVLKLVDFFGCSFVVLILAIMELITISWIYGVDRLCKDIEFMLGFRPSIYWRMCWKYITPLIMIGIFFYNIVTFKNITYGGQLYPDNLYRVGWSISAICLISIPIFAVFTISMKHDKSFLEKIKSANKPSDQWGPKDSVKKMEYQEFLNSGIELSLR